MKDLTVYGTPTQNWYIYYGPESIINNCRAQSITTFGQWLRQLKKVITGIPENPFPMSLKVKSQSIGSENF